MATCKDIVKKLRPDLLGAFERLNHKMKTLKDEIILVPTTGLIKRLDSDEYEVLVLIKRIQEELRK